MEALATESAANNAATELAQTPAADALQQLPPERAAALAKLCLAIFNLNEFLFID